MANYIDGYAFPIKQVHLDEYKQIADQVAAIWQEHGALAYLEYVGDDLNFAGTLSFRDTLQTRDDETIVFGWIVFESRESRDDVHKLIAADNRMHKLVDPLIDSDRLIFDASRMVYGGFRSLIQAN